MMHQANVAAIKMTIMTFSVGTLKEKLKHYLRTKDYSQDSPSAFLSGYLLSLSMVKDCFPPKKAFFYPLSLITVPLSLHRLQTPELLHSPEKKQKRKKVK